MKRNQRSRRRYPAARKSVAGVFPDGCVKKHDLVQLAGTDKAVCPERKNTFRAVNGKRMVMVLREKPVY